MLTILSHHPLLERLRLATIDDVRRYTGDLVKNQRGRRDIHRIATTDDAGQPLTLFLKRILNPYKKDGLRSLLRRGRVISSARQEFNNLLLLNQNGFPTSPPIAFGEDCGLLWERFSFIITAAAPGQPLEDILPQRNHPQRRKVLEATARFIRRLHDSGLATPDLFTRHLFVDIRPASSPDDPTIHLALIDMARLDHRRTVSRRLRARDLAALNATAPLRHVSRSERLHFLRAYAGAIDRPLLARIRRRMRTLLRRSKFGGFSVGPSSGSSQ